MRLFRAASSHPRHRAAFPWEHPPRCLATCQQNPVALANAAVLAAECGPRRRATYGGPMELINLSRDLFHRTHPSHPPLAIAVRNDHSEKKVADNPVFTSKALALSLSGHSGTHADAPAHFDPRPGTVSTDETGLEKFFTSAICLDLSHVPLKHAITMQEMEAALAKSGEDIQPGDTVLIYMATNRRLLGKPGYQHD